VLTVLMIGCLLLFNVKNVYAQTFFVTPNPVTQGSDFQVSGSGYPPGDSGFVEVFSTASCSGSPLPGYDVPYTPDGLGSWGPVTISPSPALSVGTHCIIASDGSGAASTIEVTSATTTTTIELPYSICVIQLGVQEQTGTVAWLPGYAYPGTPISQCQNMTDVLGQDVLDRTIMIHQFIRNGTFTEIVTIQPTVI
jgi:hypothetical protein